MFFLRPSVLSRLSSGASRKRTLPAVGRSHHLLSSSSSSLFAPCSSMALILSAANPNNYTANPYIDTFFQQTRWKRRDGHKASLQEGRAPTKKQRKAYNKSLQKQFGENPHGAPGSRAGPRREYYEALKEEWKEEDNTNDNNNELLEEYEMEDALLDDLMGNTKHLTSQPTPRPKYLGHNFAKYRDEIVRQMEVYHNRKSELEEENSSDTEAAALLVMESLPSDQSISLALRAFRDKHGTRQKPVGIVRALSYIMQDLGIPVSALSEYSFTTLLTCARTPKEGRRIMDLIKQQNHPISAYSWSILVDIYAKVGDYQGCSSVMDEMVQQNTPPGLAAYTSFLAACYKVCNDGRVAHSIRAKAAQASWEKWQEMRVVGVDPDVMAYGAMLRVCAALGHAERAINILEEMQQMEVKPTTLCFSSALRAVARSQAIAIRYENGASKRNRRREFLTSHHGKMAQSIVRLAESAHVEQDDGFVAALILCAGAVGDVATAKAIYVASEIRKMDHLRSIGPDQHLAQLRGDTIADELTAIEGSMQMVLDTNDSRNGLLSTQTGGYLDTLHPATSSRTSFEEREYGKDSRVLSAMLRACANAVDQNGIGTMWQGRENRGFLCEDSLRLLTAPRLPRYVDNSIPGQSTTDDLTWEGEDRDEDQKGQKRSTRAFKGIEELDETSLDNLDDLFEKIYLDKEGELKDEFKKTTPEDIWRMKYNDKESLALLDAIQGRPSVDRRSGSDPLSDGQLVDMFYDEATMSWTQNGRQSDRLVRETDDEDNEEMFFDFETMRWKTRQKILSNSEDKSNTSNLADGTDLNDTDRDKEGDNEELFFDVETMRWQTKPKRDVVANTGNTITEAQADANVEANAAASRGDNDNDDEDELYFDLEALRWKTRPKHEQANVSKRTKFESKILQESDELSAAKAADEEAEFARFFRDLCAEINESSESIDQVSEEEARELFSLMKEEYDEVMSMDVEELVDMGLADSDDLARLETAGQTSYDGLERMVQASKNDDFGNRQHSEDDYASQLARPKTGLNHSTSMSEDVASRSVRTATMMYPAPDSIEHDITQVASQANMAVFDEGISTSVTWDASHGLEAADDLDELRELLPAFSDKRLSKIHQVFKQNLDDPPLLELIPLVRERLPDYITATWLKQMGSLTARYVVFKAGQDGLVDIHMLNAALELETRSGSLNRAMEFYENEYSRHGVTRNGYSNRLVLQMFLDNNRFRKALAFRDKIKESGADLDIISYGSLVDYCSRHGQVGSAFLLLKECVNVHGAAPGEAYLSRLRSLCRQKGLEDKLTVLIGNDPVEWLRHGEAKLKREYTKRGRRDVQFARNRLVHL